MIKLLIAAMCLVGVYFVTGYMKTNDLVNAYYCGQTNGMKRVDAMCPDFQLTFLEEQNCTDIYTILRKEEGE